MANKQTIQDIDQALERWHRKLSMAVRRIDELRAKRKKIVAGKIKHPPHPGVKVMFKDIPNRGGAGAFDDDISDLADRPIAPGSCGPC